MFFKKCKFDKEKQNSISDDVEFYRHAVRNGIITISENGVKKLDISRAIESPVGRKRIQQISKEHILWQNESVKEEA